MSRSDGASIAARPAGRGRALSLPLTPEAVNGAVIRLAWPCMLENFFQMAMDTVNMIMVARLGAVSIAGIGTATQLLWVFNATIGAVTTGTTVMVARAVGAGRPEEG
ncbi:MAG: MATE family efflux transporter, partial [Chloroflexota bacterium]|nr:MATE family efflux transporter [Chloroflexota bacterium]